MGRLHLARSCSGRAGSSRTKRPVGSGKVGGARHAYSAANGHAITSQGLCPCVAFEYERQLGEGHMKLTYDTETDSISSPDLDAQQTASIQAVLSRALYRNDPVQDVAKLLLEAAKEAQG
jgi:hypothetical protein